MARERSYTTSSPDGFGLKCTARSPAEAAPCSIEPICDLVIHVICEVRQSTVRNRGAEFEHRDTSLHGSQGQYSTDTDDEEESTFYGDAWDGAEPQPVEDEDGDDDEIDTSTAQEQNEDEMTTARNKFEQTRMSQSILETCLDFLHPNKHALCLRTVAYLPSEQSLYIASARPDGDFHDQTSLSPRSTLELGASRRSRTESACRLSLHFAWSLPRPRQDFIDDGASTERSQVLQSYPLPYPFRVLLSRIFRRVFRHEVALAWPRAFHGAYIERLRELDSPITLLSQSLERLVLGARERRLAAGADEEARELDAIVELCSPSSLRPDQEGTRQSLLQTLRSHVSASLSSLDAALLPPAKISLRLTTDSLHPGKGSAADVSFSIQDFPSDEECPEALSEHEDIAPTSAVPYPDVERGQDAGHGEWSSQHVWGPGIVTSDPVDLAGPYDGDASPAEPLPFDPSSPVSLLEFPDDDRSDVDECPHDDEDDDREEHESPWLCASGSVDQRFGDVDDNLGTFSPL